MWLGQQVSYNQLQYSKMQPVRHAAQGACAIGPIYCAIRTHPPSRNVSWLILVLVVTQFWVVFAKLICDVLRFPCLSVCACSYRKMLDCWHIEPEERPLFKQLRSDLDQLLMVHQPDEYIKFSDIDEDKLPYYKRGTSNSENSGGSTDEDALNVSKVLNSYTATRTMRSTGAPSNETTERVVPAEVVRVGNGNIPIVIPISPQSSDGTIRGEDETQRNHHDDDLNAEPSETALTAQSSASTIRDDSGNEETKL